MRILLYMFLFCLFFYSCDTNSKIAQNNSIDSLLYNVISLDSNMYLIKNGIFIDQDSFHIHYNDSYKIFSIVDGICSKCVVNELNKLDSLYNMSFKNKNTFLIFVLNVSPADSMYFTKNLLPLIDSDKFLIWDNNYNFERINNISFKDKFYRTFLVGLNNEILYFGNPLFDTRIVNKYDSIIRFNN